MKKNALSRVISVVLSLAVAGSTLTALSTVAFAKEEVKLPDPVAVYDFSYNFDELAEKNAGFEVVENDAAPELVTDDSEYEMGQVLQLKKAIIENRKFVTKVDNDSGKVSSTGYIESEDSQYSTIKIANPYKGLDYLKEYEPYEDVEVKFYRNCSQPAWKEGITISYWIKTPAGDDGYGINSNVVGFTSNRFQMQSDEYAYHLCTIKYDLDYNALTAEQKEWLGESVVRAGVNMDSDFYFEYATEELYLGCPVYKDPDGGRMGRTYWMNKNFVEGYVRKADGSIDKAGNGQSARYDLYKEAPYLGDTEDDHKPGKSRIRYTWTYSEMWLDASSSFYFENDTENVNVQLNPNSVTSFGTKVGMQHGDSFNINSWKQYDTVVEADAAGLAADSPVTNPGEWHQVTCVIQNDWVLYYFDGEEIDIEEFYSSVGFNGLAEKVGNYKPWKRFNKGTGSRYGYGTDKTITYWCYYGNYCAPTMMEWIIKDCVNTTIGGGNIAGDGYRMLADTDEIQLKNIVFYDKVLTEDQIKVLADDPFIYDKKNEKSDGLLGDANLDESINAQDALAVLKHAASIEALEGQGATNADVNEDGAINATDALEILKFAANIITEFTPVAPKE